MRRNQAHQPQPVPQREVQGAPCEAQAASTIQTSSAPVFQEVFSADQIQPPDSSQVDSELAMDSPEDAMVKVSPPCPVVQSGGTTVPALTLRTIFSPISQKLANALTNLREESRKDLDTMRAVQNP